MNHVQPKLRGIKIGLKPGYRFEEPAEPQQ
jgi:hypothetical protein